MGTIEVIQLGVSGAVLLISTLGAFMGRKAAPPAPPKPAPAPAPATSGHPLIDAAAGILGHVLHTQGQTGVQGLLGGLLSSLVQPSAGNTGAANLLAQMLAAAHAKDSTPAAK